LKGEPKAKPFSRNGRDWKWEHTPSEDEWRGEHEEWLTLTKIASNDKEHTETATLYLKSPHSPFMQTEMGSRVEFWVEDAGISFKRATKDGDKPPVEQRNTTGTVLQVVQLLEDFDVTKGRLPDLNYIRETITERPKASDK
jgi:hypothetical protein